MPHRSLPLPTAPHTTPGAKWRPLSLHPGVAGPHQTSLEALVVWLLSAARVLRALHSLAPLYAMRGGS